jgi:hypothetical protein
MVFPAAPPEPLARGPEVLGDSNLAQAGKFFGQKFAAFGRKKEGHENYSQTGSSGLATARERGPSGSRCRYLALPGICE